MCVSESRHRGRWLSSRRAVRQACLRRPFLRHDHEEAGRENPCPADRGKKNMRDWIKGIFGGGSIGPAPDGVPEAWIKELRRNLDDGYVIGGTNLSGADLTAAMEY